MKNVIFRYLLLVCVAAVSFGCSSSGKGGEPKPENFGTNPLAGQAVTTLPDRAVRVYWGFDNKWHSITNKQTYKYWDYTRRNLTGFYTNFIDMWCMVYQNKESAEQTCKDLYDTFVNKNAFFEATMEIRVNSGENGYNDLTTDRRTIDLLTGAGFNVDYTSVNYMKVNDEANCKTRINLMRTYKGNRKCLYLNGPWTMNGNVLTDQESKTMSAWCDGFSTDGPLGFWYNDYNGMVEASYSVVKYMQSQKKETAIMLAPYAAGVSGYQSTRDFLAVSKKCVLGHEDHNAAPELWTLWMYGSDGLKLFPESSKNADGEDVPQNTATGVAYWLLKHLNEFPVLSVGSPATSGSSADAYELEVKAGQTVKVPVVVSNGNCSQVELSPVIRALFDTKTADWDIRFELNGTDVTKDVALNGGVNCIGRYRLSKGHDDKLNVVVKALRTGASIDVKLQVMSNLANTVNKRELAVLKLKSK